MPGRRDEALRHLENVPLFSALSKKDLQQVAKLSTELAVKAGTELVDQGRAGTEFFLIMSGTATVKRNGRKIATLGPGQFFGELALLDRGPRSASVVAEGDMDVLVVSAREFGGMLDEVPGVATKLLAGLAARLREADTKAVSL